MNKITTTLLGVFSIAILLSSCSVEKRVHQNGYHISWKHRHSEPSDFAQTNEKTANNELIVQSRLESHQPNVHSVETISASSNESNELILPAKKSSFIQSNTDTIVPDQSKQQEEYFSNNYVAPERPQDIKDQQTANWALGLGIGAVSLPLWATILFLGIGTAAGFSWALLGLFFILGLALFVGLEITSISLAIRFLRLHGKDPDYRKYRSRAITGLILAGIYPALIAINIILAIVLAI